MEDLDLRTGFGFSGAIRVGPISRIGQVIDCENENGLWIGRRRPDVGSMRRGRAWEIAYGKARGCERLLNRQMRFFRSEQ